MKLALACDHAAFELKDMIKEILIAGGNQVDDCGTDNANSVDYPDFAKKVAQRVHDGSADLGILICGTGIGMSIAANKVAGVRAALCHNEFTAQMARAHNDANVLCIGARVIGRDIALAITKRFLQTPFEGGRHGRRVEKIHALEQGA